MPIVEILAEVVLQSVVALGAEAISRASLGDEAKRVAAWQALATKLGGRWAPPEGGALPTFYGGIDVERGDWLGHLEAHIRRTGGNTGAYTVAQAPFVLGAGPKLGVYRQGLNAAIGKLFGSEDVLLGEETFDDAFVVHSGGDVEGTKAALTNAVQGRLLTSHRDSVMSSDGKVVTLAWRKLEHDVDKLEAALEIVLGVARCRVDWFEEVGRVQRARRVAPAGGLLDRQPLSYAFDDAVVPVRVFPALLNTVLVLRVHAKHERPIATSVRAEIGTDGGFDRAEVPDGVIPSAVVSRLAELGGARFGAERDEVWIDLAGRPSSTRVELAVQLVAAIASGVEGSAFR